MTIVDRDRTAEASRRSWAAALATACPVHDAPAGVPCWPVPEGLCGRRVRSAGYTGRSDHASKPNPRLTGKSFDRRIREATR